eukprot:156806-Pelagomonas_calceolata.AAC.7
MVPNPEFQGAWKAKKIKNPNYKGKWEAPEIDNPDYKPNAELYAFNDLKFVGFELWQVRARPVGCISEGCIGMLQKLKLAEREPIVARSRLLFQPCGGSGALSAAATVDRLQEQGQPSWTNAASCTTTLVATPRLHALLFGDMWLPV